MLTTEELLNGLPAALTLRFFATFARFEFAMKQCGCLQRTGEGEMALASRRLLESRLPADFFERLQRLGSAHILIEAPPKSLFVDADRKLDFGAQPIGLLSTRDLLDAVWAVRNNLFHRNKMYPSDRVRDADLMNATLAAIDLVLQEDRALFDAFHEP